MTSYWSHSSSKCITCPYGWNVAKSNNHTTCYSYKNDFRNEMVWKLAEESCARKKHPDGKSIY